jgi:hypothetical protein
MASRVYLAEKEPSLVAPLDVLIEEILHQIDEEDVRASAVEAARTVSSILLRLGGDAAREALGIPPPDPVWQAYWRNRGSPGSAEIGERLNQIQLEISDKAACGVGGRGYWVSATLWLPGEDANGPYEGLDTPKSSTDGD